MKSNLRFGKTRMIEFVNIKCPFLSACLATLNFVSRVLYYMLIFSAYIKLSCCLFGTFPLFSIVEFALIFNLSPFSESYVFYFALVIASIKRSYENRINQY